jgi:hypothetical protein
MTYLCDPLTKPTRLYIKQCSHCNLKYFGKHTGQNIEVYSGSGTKWNNHLSKYNAKPVHLWNSDWYYDTSISRFAIKFSRLNKIVDSDNWANLKEENGLEGGWDHIDSKGKVVSEETRRRMSASAAIRQKGETNSFYGKAHSEETKMKIGKHSKQRAKRIYDERLLNGNHPNNSCICPHCNKSGQYRAMKRWHFDNCRVKVSSVFADNLAM